MELKDTISLVLFLLFFTSYLLKLILLWKKNGIRAHVLGTKGKPAATRMVETAVKISSLVWGILWFAYSLDGNRLLKSFPAEPWITWVGITVTSLGLFLFILAMLWMKNSWRVGIDKTTQTALITTGIYQYSRNPAFTGFDLMFIGFMFMYPNVLNFVVGACNLYFFHLLIRQEEMHLEVAFGAEYGRYAKQTPRYLWFF